MLCTRGVLVVLQCLDARKPMNRDLTVKDVAMQLSVSIDWVRDRCNDRTFQGSYRIADGSGWRIPQIDVDRWKENRRRAVSFTQ